MQKTVETNILAKSIWKTERANRLEDGNKTFEFGTEILRSTLDSAEEFDPKSWESKTKGLPKEPEFIQKLKHSLPEYSAVRQE